MSVRPRRFGGVASLLGLLGGIAASTTGQGFSEIPDEPAVLSAAGNAVGNVAGNAALGNSALNTAGNGTTNVASGAASDTESRPIGSPSPLGTAVSAPAPHATATPSGGGNATPAATPQSIVSARPDFFDLLKVLKAPAAVRIEDLEKRLTTATHPRNRLTLLLGIARARVQRGELAPALSAIEAAAPLARTGHQTLLVAYALVASEYHEKKGDHARVVDLLAPFVVGNQVPMQAEVVRRYFRSLVALGDTSKALALVRLHPRIVVGAVHEAALEGSLLALSAKLERDGNLVAARELLMTVARKFPITAEARTAFQKLTEQGCDVEQELLSGNASEVRALALRLVRDFGHRDDLRQLGLALMKIDERKLVPSRPVDALPDTEKARLLDTAEFLLQAWEYKSALVLLEVLKNAKTDSSSMRRERVLFLYGRALNQLERYADAAKVYAQIVAMGPSSAMRATVRERLLLSLHYAGRYEEELEWMKRLARGRNGLLEWDYFWVQYLAGKLDGASQTGRALVARAKRNASSPLAPRVSYWLARIEERRGRIDVARSLFAQVANGFSTSHYAVWARWRLEILSGRERKQPAWPTIAAARGEGLSWPAPREVEELDLVRDLVEAGLSDVARSVFETYDFERESLSPALAAFQAGKYRYALVRADGKIREELKAPVSDGEFRRDVEARSQFWRLSFPLAHFRSVTESTRFLGISNAFVLSIMRGESMFSADAVSSVGALGLMQIMPRTGQHIARLVGDHGFDPTQLLIPEVNVAFGAWYLQRLQTYYRGNYVLASAAYNAGPAAVDRWLRQAPQLELDEFSENVPYDQTHAYIGKILRNMDAYVRIYGKGEGLSVELSRALPKPVDGMEMF